MQIKDDFDAENIQESLAILDDELDQVEEEKPDDEGDEYDAQIRDIIEANSVLRVKVGEISEFVGKAIIKAASLRKQPRATEDHTSDPSVLKKQEDVKDYQRKIMKAKKRIKELQTKLRNSIQYQSQLERDNEISAMQRENKTLEEEARMLKQQNEIQEK